MGAVEAGDFGLQLRPSRWGFGEEPPDVCEQAGGCVAASEEDVQEFAADTFAVVCLAHELVDEDVALGFLIAGLEISGLLLVAVRAALFYVVVDEIVHELLVLVHISYVKEEGEPFHPGSESRTHCDVGLAAVEGCTEAFLAGLAEGVCAFAEEELGCGVEGEAEEKVRQVDGAAVFREFRDQVGDVFFECRHVADLASDEVGTEHLAGVSPVGAIVCEDS